MSPITHLLASWIIASKTTDNLRDRRLVSLAGIAPDLDGLGLVADIIKGGDPYYYPTYHHWLGHGLAGALVCSAFLTCFARRKGRVFLLAMLMFHLHLLCDLAGSRGPEPKDLWPIYYFGPFSYRSIWVWKHQWGLDAWPNRIISVVLFVWALWIATKLGDSFVGVFNRKVDRIVVAVLQKWRAILFPTQ